jgi:large subunit ribosomal protein L21
VEASNLGEEKGEKQIIFKYKAKKNYRVKTGHRQHYTRIKIEKFNLE